MGRSSIRLIARVCGRRSSRRSPKRRPYRLDYRIVHADGTLRWVAEHGRGVVEPGGDRVWLDGVLLDVTQQKLAEQARDQAEQQLKDLVEASRHEALHDPVTGLPNRTLFRDQLDRVVVDAANGGREFAVLMLDLDWIQGDQRHAWSPGRATSSCSD